MRLTVLLLLLFACGAASYGQARSAEQLIDYLTAPRPASNEDWLVDVCLSYNAEEIEGFHTDRAAAQDLVKLGEAAIPAIEKKLGSGAGSVRNAWLVTHAYAKIGGPAAAPLLSRLGASSSLDRIAGDSMALALGLSGYVFSGGVLPSFPTHYCRPPLPQDTIDQFLLAWEQNNPTWLASRLGPRARASLDALTRAGLWPVNTSGSVAVGYRIDAQPLWREPEETLASLDLPPLQFENPEEPANPVLDVVFTDGAGAQCGTHSLTLLGDGRGHQEYTVDEPDLEGLLRLIATCAARGH